MFIALATWPLLAALLPIHERALEPEHPHTLIIRGNLAYWAGKAEEVTPGAN